MAKEIQGPFLPGAVLEAAFESGGIQALKEMLRESIARTVAGKKKTESSFVKTKSSDKEKN